MQTDAASKPTYNLENQMDDLMQKTNHYRKKPVVIEARQLTPETAEEIGAWCGAELCKSVQANYESYLWGWDLDIKDRSISIPTLEGDMIASMGDWVIKGVKDEFYPCKPDIFEMTYEPVPLDKTSK